ncbi:hypothetical protein ACOME3_010110 [Neoechinorhynchus agilis]
MPNSRVVRWARLLGEYDYIVEYAKGSDNVHADCFSRLPMPSYEDQNTFYDHGWADHTRRSQRFPFRLTPHSSTGEAPAVAMMGGKLRGALDRIMPDNEDEE